MANPERRWKDNDFQQLSVDASTARRQFKKRFGMTFVEYAGARRMGLAMKQSGQERLLLMHNFQQDMNQVVVLGMRFSVLWEPHRQNMGKLISSKHRGWIPLLVR